MKITDRRKAYGLLPLLAALLALTLFIMQERSPAEAQEAPHLTSWEVLDEYGSLHIRPDFIAYPTQAQIVFVAPGIRKVKIKPHWEGSGITVNVATYDISRKGTIDSDTVTTSGTASSFLGIAPGGGTKLNISVTKGSQTTVYSKKYLTREANAANADNYLNSMGISPNPNARPNPNAPRNVVPMGQGSSQVSLGSKSVLSGAKGLINGRSEHLRQSAGEDQQATRSITLTPTFSPDVQEYSATVPYEVSSVIVNLAPSHSKATATVNGNSPSTPVSLSVGENVITVVVTAENGYQRTYTVTVTRSAANRAPALSGPLADATIASADGTSQVSLSGVFTDADGDALTVTASSSSESVATVSVSADYSTLTVTAKNRGTATVTVTASDGKGGTVGDTFTVTVKAAPTVASAIADVSGLDEGSTREISLSGVFSDADGDSLTITAASSNDTVATVSVADDYSSLTLAGKAEGTATVTVTAQDSDGNSVSDAFDITVNKVVELPGPVVSLELAATYDNVTVSWSAPESGDAPQGYIVHIKRKGGGYQDTRSPGAAKTALTFRGLNSGSTYNVWVRARNEAGKGERTHASITLPAEMPGPVASLELTATTDAVTVSWSAPETGGAPDGYIVHLSPEDGGKGKTKRPKAKKTQVTFKNLEAGRTYEVWVRAQNEAGKGERAHVSITLPEEEDGQQPGGQAGQ